MANEKRLISLDDALEALNSEGITKNMRAHRKVAALSTVDAVEVVHGRWENPDGIYSCSVCGKSNPYDVLGDNIWYWPCNYCPNCGADMRGKTE